MTVNGRSRVKHTVFRMRLSIDGRMKWQVFSAEASLDPIANVLQSPGKLWLGCTTIQHAALLLQQLGVCEVRWVFLRVSWIARVFPSASLIWFCAWWVFVALRILTVWTGHLSTSNWLFVQLLGPHRSGRVYPLASGYGRLSLSHGSWLYPYALS